MSGHVSGIRPASGSVQASEALTPPRKVKRLLKFKSPAHLLAAAFGCGIVFGVLAYLNSMFNILQSPLNPIITGVVGFLLVLILHYFDLISAYGT